MKKFWRSGMIDKKVVREREQEEYINRLHRTILELSRKPPEPEPKYAIVHTSDNRSHKVRIADDYDEVRVGDNVILEFFSRMNRNRPNYNRYEADITFDKNWEKNRKTLNDIRKAKGFEEK